MLLLWYYFDHPFEKGLYHGYNMGKVLAAALLLSLGTIWFWLRPSKRH
jgi:hypothetical protein